MHSIVLRSERNERRRGSRRKKTDLTSPNDAGGDSEDVPLVSATPGMQIGFKGALRLGSLLFDHDGVYDLIRRVFRYLVNSRKIGVMNLASLFVLQQSRVATWSEVHTFTQSFLACVTDSYEF